VHIRAVQQTVHTRALHRAAEILGGRVALCGYLDVRAGLLDLWMQGAWPPPLSVFLRVVDLLLEQQVKELYAEARAGYKAGAQH
jgi:hypothetical protein